MVLSIKPCEMSTYHCMCNWLCRSLQKRLETQ